MVLGAVLLSSGAAHAQRRESAIVLNRGLFAIAPFAGYLVGENFVEGPLNTNLGGVAAPMYGAQVSFPLAPSASIVGTLGYANGDLEVGLPIVGGVSVGDNRAFLFDASVELRPDWDNKGKALIPIFQIGGGAMHRELSVIGASAKSTDFVVSGGAGADLPFMPNLAMRVMVKDYYGKADFGTIGELTATTRDFHTLGVSAGVRFSF
jgi:opacity protein-like surface antigen